MTMQVTQYSQLKNQLSSSQLSSSVVSMGIAYKTFVLGPTSTCLLMIWYDVLFLLELSIE